MAWVIAVITKTLNWELTSKLRAFKSNTIVFRRLPVQLWTTRTNSSLGTKAAQIGTHLTWPWFSELTHCIFLLPYLALVCRQMEWLGIIIFHLRGYQRKRNSQCLDPVYSYQFIPKESRKHLVWAGINPSPLASHPTTLILDHSSLWPIAFTLRLLCFEFLWSYL